ncbi:MAG: tetratricopeptide repeat protein [Deltaproteobacteria bacterium]|nr:tetratricopeptide repeat protein [Deltaproteobacteria bacterium]
MKITPQLSKWILKLVILLALVTLVSYTFYLNPQRIELNMPSGGKWQAPAALMLIVIFCIGLICASFVAILIGIKQKFISWLESRQAHIEQANKKLMLVAREHLATRDLEQAANLFERIVSSETNNIMARIMLAQVRQAQGKYREALKILDEARQTDRQNLELLMLAAELNEQLGNETAAYDNLAIALRAQPGSKCVLKNLVHIAASLNRYDDALNLLEKLIKLSPSAQQQELLAQKADLEFEILRQKSESEASWKLALNEMEKRYRDHAPTLTTLARFAEEENNYELAIKLYTRAYKNCSEVEILNLMAHACLRQENPDKAISTVKSALSLIEPNSVAAYDGQLFLSSLLIHLGVNDQALTVLGNIEPLLQSSAQKATAKVLRSFAQKARGQANEAYEQLYAALGDTDTGEAVNKIIFAHGLAES